MKRSRAVLLALAIGLMYSPSGAVALAEGKEIFSEIEENVAENMEDKENTAETEDLFIQNPFGNSLSPKEEKEELLDNKNSGQPQEVEAEEHSDCESIGLKSLQIPQKFEVVIDPWEMDRRGQVYSEQYTICNTGETSGILTLSNLACKPRGQSGVIVRTDKDGLHDSGDKSIYMEMLFGNGDQIIFSQENSRYQTELKPGGELSICFAGEVNENAFEKWENTDIVVSVVYSWEMEEKSDDTDMEKKKDLWIDEKLEEIVDEQESVIDEEAEKEKEDQEESLQTDISSESLEEASNSSMTEENAGEKELEDTNTENLEENLQVDISSENLEEIPESCMDERQSQEQQNNIGEVASEEKPLENINTETQQNDSPDPSIEVVDGQVTSEILEEEIKSIELQEPKKIDVAIDSWVIDENGKITSTKYKLKNTGDTTGTWNFTELACKPQEQSGIRICTNQEEVHSEDTKSVYIELMLENEKKVSLSQKNSDYELKLKPGEEVSVCFVGEMSRELLETWKEGNIAVTAVCFWNIEQTAMK